MESPPSPVLFLPVVDDNNVVRGIVTLHGVAVRFYTSVCFAGSYRLIATLTWFFKSFFPVDI
jgi:hypothetical protein